MMQGTRVSIRTFSDRLGLNRRAVDITSGRLRDNIWQLSWPLAISQGLFFFPGLYDAYWLGRLGPHALAAAGLTMSLRYTMISVLMALSGASGAVVARYVGAREGEQADLATAQGVLLFVVASGALGLVGYLFVEPLLRLAGAQGDLLAPSIAYARVIFMGLIAMEMVPSMGAMLNAAGSPQLSLQMNLLNLLTFLALEPLFIWLGWDVSGAALAIVLGNVAGMAYGLYLLATGQAPVRIHLRDLRPNWPMMWRILRIALPGIVQRGMPNLANSILMRFVASYGAAPLAAFNLIGRIATMILIPCSGLSGATPALVGQNLGAGQPPRAERAVNLIAMATVFITGVLLGLTVLLAGPIFSLFTQDADTIAAGVHALRILVIARFFFTLGVVFDAALSGAGDTVSPMVINIIALWLIQLPFIWLFSGWLGWGVDGIWWAIVFTMIAQTALLAARFRQGRWQQTRL
jgi:putative MATE family efflux protein